MGYPSAPITECSLTFAFDDIDVDRFVDVFNEVIASNSLFEEVADIVRYAPHVDEHGDRAMRPHQIGRAARSMDAEVEVAVFGPSIRFTSRSSYSTWEDFTSVSDRWISAYMKALKPRQVVAIIANFENYLPVPDAPFEVSDYTRFFSNVPPMLPQSHSELSSSVRFSWSEEIEVVLSIGTDTNDIDRLYPGLRLRTETQLNRTIDLTDERSTPELERALQEIRVAKNEVFEASVTDATRMLMEGGTHANH